MIVGPDMMTGQPGIFAGGDMVPASARSPPPSATARRRRATSMRGCAAATTAVAAKHPIVDFDMLNLPIYSDADALRCRRELPVGSATGGFDEVVAGLSETEARYEAQRCLSCGNCFECDNCFAACPEDAIVKLGPAGATATIYDRCTGCAVCFDNAPATPSK